MNLTKLHTWHQSRKGLLLFGLVELLAAYLIGSRAIDTGSLIEYGLTIVLIVGSLHNFFRLIGILIHNGKR